MDIKSRYVIIHKQGWIPIFIEDGLDAVMLAEICVENGLKAIEITCRRLSSDFSENRNLICRPWKSLQI